MYASIRRYKTDSVDEVAQRVIDGFVPLISNAPGFVAYYGIDTGQGTWAGVSVFESQAGAEGSNRLAADWVKENVASLVDEPEIMAGEVVAHSTV